MKRLASLLLVTAVAWALETETTLAGGRGYAVQQAQQYPIQVTPQYPIQSPPCLPPNPVVYDSGRYVSGYCAGPRPVRRQVETNREVVHASALDPNRDVADPGSLVRVDRQVWGSDGVWHREQGYHWTSDGVPHSDVNLSQSYRTGLFRSRTDNTHVLKETP